jgi:pimeloyl-ACP methyl ester carboxylesterase
VGVAQALVAEAGDPSIAAVVGHSFGGTSAVAAAAQHPELFQRLLLVDPVVLSPRSDLDPDQQRRRRALVAGARRRRDVFASRAEARASWARHGFFASWDRRVLELYVEEGLREREDGQVELKCSKEIEATIFERSGSLDLFSLAPQVRAPVLILWAVHGSFPRPVYEALAASLPRALVEDIDAGHLAPMECPERIARTLGAFARGGS